MTPDKANEPPHNKVLVSACLLGTNCTYKAGHNRDLILLAELEAEGLEAVPFCPEEHGGLATPRPAADLTGTSSEVLDTRARVRTIEQREDVTAAFLKGANGALALCEQEAIRRAFLKERSPSCGCEWTHEDGALVRGSGVTAELLRRHGIECVGVEGRRAEAD